MIEVEHLCKTFTVSRRDGGMKQALSALFHREKETIHALDDVSFRIDDGEMVGYIGPNGAGKSSTIKVMSGILTPDSGICRINGLVPWKQRREHVSRIGVVFGQRSHLWWDIPVTDSFALIKDIYRISDGVYQKNLSRLTEMLSLQEILRTPARQLSLGQRMRCEIAASLLHDPAVLFLDEPTIGLDAVSKLSVRDFIRQLNREKATTIILTTHDMQDIEALAGRIILIGKGRILMDGDTERFRQQLSPVRTVMVSARQFMDIPLPDGVRLVQKQGENGGRLTFTVNTEKVPIPQLIGLLSSHLEMYDLSVENVSMDELVLSLYRKYQI